METDMAKVAMGPVARRDPKNLNNKMSLAQVKALAPSFDWELYLKLVKAPLSTPHYLVTSPDFFKGVEVLLNQHPLEHWKTYLRWQMLHGSAPALNEAFVREGFDFFGHTLFGAEELQPRWATLRPSYGWQSRRGSRPRLRITSLSFIQQAARAPASTRPPDGPVQGNRRG